MPERPSEIKLQLIDHRGTHAIMWLTAVQVEAVLYALRDLVSRRVLGGQPIRQEIQDLYEQLLAGSTHGTKNDPLCEELAPDDLIDTKEAATILGCSTRWVRRIHADLDGQSCGGRWVFRRQAVVEYAELKGVDGEGNRIPPAGSRAVSSRITRVRVGAAQRPGAAAEVASTEANAKAHTRH
jgi:hypothetical protein